MLEQKALRGNVRTSDNKAGWNSVRIPLTHQFSPR